MLTCKKLSTRQRIENELTPPVKTSFSCLCRRY